MSIRNSRGAKRWMVAAAAAAVGASTLAIAGPTSALPGPPDAERVSGDTRYETAVEVAQATPGGPFCDVVIASGENFPDGLAAAAFYEPILLTEAASLRAETKAYLDELVGTPTTPGPCAAVNSTVVGGTAVVSSAQFEVLSDYGTATRVSGATRYATALEVAEAAIPGGTTTAIIATGQNFPDALAGGSLAQAMGAPILLNDGESVSPEVAAYLFDSDPGAGVTPVTKVYILGGTAAVPQSVEDELKGPLGITTVERLSGSNRSATAVEIADEVYPTGTPSGNLVVVNGFDFPDALSAAPFAHVAGAPIVLTAADSIPAATATYHNVWCDPIEKIWAIGGTAVISDTVVAGAVEAATCSAPEIVSATLLNDDFQQAVFTINAGTTVTADAGTAADGAAANAWQVALIQDGTPGNESVVVDPEGNDIAALGGIPTFIVTANLPLLTNAGFVSIWNTGAGSITTAATTDPTGVTGLTGGTAVAPNIIPPGALFAVPGDQGSQDSTVVVTFDRAVTTATPSGIHPDLNPATGPLPMGGFTQDPVAIPADGVTEVTYEWDDVTTAQPSLPFSQIRFPAGNIVDAASSTPSVLTAAETLVAP